MRINRPVSDQSHGFESQLGRYLEMVEWKLVSIYLIFQVAGFQVDDAELDSTKNLFNTLTVLVIQLLTWDK